LSGPTRKLFGTDGIRGTANKHPITTETVVQLGRAIGYQLSHRIDGRRPKVLIGKDTRLSCYMIEMALASGLCSAGVDVHLLGPVPTPGVAFLTRDMRADAGMMISASHNPFEDNGIKIFAGDGYKLPDAEEAAIEEMMRAPSLEHFRPTGTGIGRAFRIGDAVGRYSVFAKSSFPKALTLEGMRIVVDCAHGAGYKVAPQVLQELGAEVIPLGVSPDGTNINGGCGALHADYMARHVTQYRADVGIALDGDADRCMLADETGQIIDGDRVIALIGRWMKAQGRLRGNTVVATVMSNLGLDRAMREVGAKVERVAVGDRYVVERMRAHDYMLGGEQSGHVIVHDHGTTGDGLVTALTVLGILAGQSQPLSELAACMERFPQVLENVPVSTKPPIETLPKVVAAIAQAEAEFADNGRVLVRYSGTQMLARVMVEGPSMGPIKRAAERIASALAKAAG
jgi:phosphoglucosamine mutase